LSSAFVAIRIAIPHLIAAGRTLARLLVASLVLAAAAPLLKVRRPERADLPPLVGCGLCGMAGYQLLLNAGERTVPAGTANLLVNTSPVIAACWPGGCSANAQPAACGPGRGVTAQVADGSSVRTR
jgi:drug/metabolite transporter (DMT)-like permease